MGKEPSVMRGWCVLVVGILAIALALDGVLLPVKVGICIWDAVVYEEE